MDGETCLRLYRKMVMNNWDQCVGVKETCLTLYEQNATRSKMESQSGDLLRKAVGLLTSYHSYV